MSLNKQGNLSILFLAGVLSFPAPLAAQTLPEISIANPARCGPGGETPMDMISGTVKFAPSGTKVAIFAWAGSIWWIQPWANAYSTVIKNDRWANETHLGQRYAALLVRNAWTSAATLAALPPVAGDVLAAHEVACRR